MNRIRVATVFTSLLLVAAWSTPLDAAGEQRRARRRNPGTTQTQRAPRRTAPRASTPQRQARPQRAPAARQQQRSDRGGGSARRATPRRAPRRDAGGPNRGSGRERRVSPPANTGGSRVMAPQENRPGGRTAVRRGDRSAGRNTRVVAPSSPGASRVGQTGRSGGRNSRAGRAGSSGRGTGQVNRRPPRGNIVGSAVRRPPLRSGPIVVNNYGGNRGGRERGRVRGYTPYRGRYRHGSRSVYGSYFFVPGYSSFNVGIGVGHGSGYGYNPYWNGYYGRSYGYSPYAYDGYGRDYYTGSLRLKVQPRFGEVFVDGYYVGLVNDYDGIFQRLRLEEGPHHIEITESGFETLAFDVLILPGETITYEGYLTPLP